MRYREHSRYVEGVGAVCDYSLFDFERYGDETFGAAVSGFLDSSQRYVFSIEALISRSFIGTYQIILTLLFVFSFT